MSTKRVTLEEFLRSELRFCPNATGELSTLLREIGLAAKRIYAAFSSPDENGATGCLDKNASGEIIRKPDQFANDALLSVFKQSMNCAGAASEEEEGVLVFDNAVNNKSKYVVMFDPIDGSSNCDNCMIAGTIFGIYKRKSEPGKSSTVEDFLQKGRRLVAAGYILYSSTTTLVYATRRGVNGFTLNTAIGEFCLSHPSLRCPAFGKVYSVNESNALRFGHAVREYIRGLQQYNVASPGSFSARYVGSMAADLHRILLEGGIFLYPAMDEAPEGKLRLMYECNPFAFIFEVAGGMATDGVRNILDISPGGIHQRTPVFIGSREMVRQLRRFLKYDRAPGIKYRGNR
jgi:fructose-1,6-bisphosphatase I